MVLKNRRYLYDDPDLNVTMSAFSAGRNSVVAMNEDVGAKISFGVCGVCRRLATVKSYVLKKKKSTKKLSSLRRVWVNSRSDGYGFKRSARPKGTEARVPHDTVLPFVPGFSGEETTSPEGRWRITYLCRGTV
jgi:hypothetical protein